MTEPTTISLLTQHAEKIAAELKKSVGNDIEWREKQAEQWGFIRAHIESQSGFNDTVLRWQKDHQNKDDDNFDVLNAKIDSKVGAVSSQVGGLETDKERVKAVWKAAGWMVASLTAAGTFAVWLTERLLSHFSKGQP